MTKLIESVEQAVEVLSEHLHRRIKSGHPISVLTGAGISTGKNGTYVRFRDYKPITYQQFAGSSLARKRYWARSFLGFPQMMKAKPNESHNALARLQTSYPGLFHSVNGKYTSLLTQNVDSLHSKAGSEDVLELHGSLRQVVCLSCKERFSREAFQYQLRDLNPDFASLFWDKPEDHTMRPDGDVELGSLRYESFKYPSCSSCRDGILKPQVTFFGENMEQIVRDASISLVSKSSMLFIIGSSVEVYSAFRLARLADENRLPVVILNMGKTRADKLDHATRFNVPCGDVLPRIVEQVTS